MAPSPITAPCNRTFTAVHKSGVRTVDKVIWVVLHSTEGDTAESAARWFTQRASSGSAHLVVDDLECYRCLRNVDVPWAAPGANTQGFHIEQAGHASWTAAEWKRHDLTLRRAAYKTALHAQLFGIPLRWIDAAGLQRGKPGVTTHAACTEAFGGDHTDPGAGYPRALFMRYAKAYLAELEGV